MKNFVLAFFACFCLFSQALAQDCEVVPFKTLGLMYPATQINLFDEYSLDLSKLPLLDPPVKNLSLNSAYKAYVAPSDSSIMIFVVKDQISFFRLCPSKEVCGKDPFYIEQNIIEEFMRLQKAGVFQGTASVADSLIRHIVWSMENMYPGENTPVPQEYSFSSIVYNYDRERSAEFGDSAVLVLALSTLCFYDTKKVTSTYFCGLVDTVRQCGADFRPEAEPPLLARPSVGKSLLPGLRFRAFDMNGNFVRGGTWREGTAGEFRTPTIVRFENGVTVPLYRSRER